MSEVQCHKCGAMLRYGLCKSCDHVQCAECKPFPPTEMEKKDEQIRVLREALSAARVHISQCDCTSAICGEDCIYKFIDNALSSAPEGEKQP